MEDITSSAISVSKALGIAKGQLESITLKIAGEVSELSINPRYKAVYFTVKDERSSLPCMMWNNRYAASGADLKIGESVEIEGRFTLFAAKGRMNFEAFSIELVGEGSLRVRIARLAKKLHAEGLMDPARKLPLPKMPKSIGVVTSPRGAAVYDILRTLRRRYPISSVLVAGVPVEGKGAPGHLIEGLDALKDAGAEVIILARGGGSFEDLMPFNDEELARHIASLDVPVVTGIGHEPDTTIADMVADARASTPTAAAERVAPSGAEILSELRAARSKLDILISTRLHNASSRLLRASSSNVFNEPDRMLGEMLRQADDVAIRLQSAIPKSLSCSKEKLNHMAWALRLNLANLLNPYEYELASGENAVIDVGGKIEAPFREHLSRFSASLSALSPLNVLARGYSIAKNAKGDIVRSVSQVRIGENVRILVKDGTVECSALGKKERALA